VVGDQLYFYSSILLTHHQHDRQGSSVSNLTQDKGQNNPQSAPWPNRKEYNQKYSKQEATSYMTPISEKNKKPGVCYAWTEESRDIPALELPVIDFTQPAFAFEITPDEVNAHIDGMVRSTQALSATPPQVLQAIIQKSLLMRGMMVDSANTYTTGMMTYLNKLGPDNLGDGYASPGDRQWAASLTPVTFRWRMRDVARLLSSQLVSVLEPNPCAPLHLVNIAGGPGMDTLNALILLNQAHPNLLARRKITIHLLDLDPSGPIFGARALVALSQPGCPLAGVDAAIIFHEYDWTQTGCLTSLLSSFEPKAVVAASSEGGLFEYGSDADIIANLQVISDLTPPTFFMVGPVIRDSTTLDPRLKNTENVPNRPSVRYIGLEKFGQLASYAGFRIEKSLDGPMHQVVLLLKTTL
jgi:hypothetical protein